MKKNNEMVTLCNRHATTLEITSTVPLNETIEL